MKTLRRLSTCSVIVAMAASCSNDAGEAAGGTESVTTGDGTTGDGTTSTTTGMGGVGTTGEEAAAISTASTGTGGQAGSTTTGNMAGSSTGSGGVADTTSDGAGAGGGATSSDGTTAGDGGVGGLGGATSGTSTGGTGGSTSNGELRIDDPVPGYASVAGGTNGGGTDIGSAITVSSMSELQAAAGGSSPAIILVEPGEYRGGLSPGANKTIVGTEPGVTITGYVKLSGSDVNNVIIRNLAVRGERCNSYDECKAGDDAVYVGNGAHHVWLDHLDIADGQDGNCDITQGGDYVTVSWTHFHYTYDKEHRFSNLIAGSDDEPASVGKLRITYMNSHWGERVDQRQPRGRFGNVHMLNNYHNTGGSQIHGVGKDMALIAENSVYQENRSIWTDMGSPRGWQGIGNQGSGSDLNATQGAVFEVPYQYTPMPTSEVVARVTSETCGAGNTCTLAR